MIPDLGSKQLSIKLTQRSLIQIYKGKPGNKKKCSTECTMAQSRKGTGSQRCVRHES
jgi:hypothetical protein